MYLIIVDGFVIDKTELTPDEVKTLERDPDIKVKKVN